MRFGATIWLAMLGLLLLGGCANKRDEAMRYNPADFARPDAIPVAQTTGVYRLGVGDVVTVRIYNVDSMSGDQTIDAAGNISMPLIGAVPAAGKTTDELGSGLAQALGAKYLQSPQVTVTLKTAVPKTITVDGSVTQPGQFPVPDKTSLLNAVALARGTAEGANPKKVVVFRQINGQRQAAAFDLTTIRNGTDPDPVIYPNDVIVVDGRTTSPTWRAVLQTVPLLGLFARF
jgi:polysaccharide export outer membrane protein